MKNTKTTSEADILKKEKQAAEQTEQANRETRFYKIISRTSFYRPWKIK
ncbi:hypothetical protein ACFLVR_01840 [Chloroflexota bacterium]